MNEKTFSGAEALRFCIDHPGVVLECLDNSTKHPLIKYVEGDSGLSVKVTEQGGWTPLCSKLDLRYSLTKYTGLKALSLSAAAAFEGRLRKFRGKSGSSSSWVGKDGILYVSSHHPCTCKREASAFDNESGPYVEEFS